MSFIALVDVHIDAKSFAQILCVPMCFGKEVTRVKQNYFYARRGAMGHMRQRCILKTRGHQERFVWRHLVGIPK